MHTHIIRLFVLMELLFSSLVSAVGRGMRNLFVGMVVDFLIGRGCYRDDLTAETTKP